MVITIGQRLTFEANVSRGRDEDCWPFKGGDQVLVGGRRLRPQWLAAALARGRPLSPDETVRSKCETPHCCNPVHLRVMLKVDAPYMALRPVPSKLPDRAEDATCSYCGARGGGGTAVVCGAPMACPVCTAPGWAELVARYGAECA